MPIHVAVGAIEDASGRFLLSRRHPGSHQGETWEFPGGKLEPGETVVEALRRELLEELAINPVRAEPLITIPFHYPGRAVELHVMRVTTYDGSPRAMEAQPLAWVPSRALGWVRMPPANYPIVRALQLPVRAFVSSPAPEQLAEFCELVRQAVRDKAGALCVLHWPSIADRPRLVKEQARRAVRALAGSGSHVLLQTDAPALAFSADTHGVLLSADVPGVLADLSRRPRGWLVGVSCRDAEQLAAAASADFAFLGPVSTVAGQPHRLENGWKWFAGLVHEARLPVYATGDLATNSAVSSKHGAQGVAETIRLG